MKERDKQTITKNMVQIGVLRSVADKIAEGAKLIGSKAEDFADDNEDLVSLSAAQEMALLGIIGPYYEAIVRRNVRIDLAQFEFDALVSFVYNPGGLFLPVAHALNSGRVSDAMGIIKSRIITGHRKSSGLIHRRTDEIQLYLHAAYHRHAHKHHARVYAK